MLCRVNWHKVVGLSEKCNASIFRIKQSENSDFCFPQFSRFYNRLNIQQLYNTTQSVYCPQHGSIIAHKARIRRHISWKLLCSGTRYSGVIPIILTGAPRAGCRRYGKATHTHNRPTSRQRSVWSASGLTYEPSPAKYDAGELLV
jgi:hypothetical protein